MALTRNKKKSIPAKAVDVLPTKAVAALPAKAATRAGKKRWHDMESSQRATLVAAGVVQVSMAAAAWIDLARRPSEKVRGPKALWAVVISVNVVGPVLYLLAGRTSGDAPSSDSRSSDAGSSGTEASGDARSGTSDDEPALTGS